MPSILVDQAVKEELDRQDVKDMAGIQARKEPSVRLKGQLQSNLRPPTVLQLSSTKKYSKHARLSGSLEG